MRRRPAYDQFTPLVASIEPIYEVTKKEGLFKKPTPLSANQSKDKKKCCAYHESHGHDTHECRHLKEEIEKLIHDGKLTEWVVREIRRHKDTPVIVEEAKKDKEGFILLNSGVIVLVKLS